MRLRVLSLNVWGLPEPVGRDVAARMERINERLPSFGADVVLYQEVWTEEARAQLIEGGQSAGFAHSWYREPPVGGSGLLALARQPFARTHFTPYTLCGLPQRVQHADFYSGKGVVELELDVAGVPVTLFGTHMHARYAPANVIDQYIGHRAGEVIEFAERVRLARGPVVAVGDFNMREDSAEYGVLLGLTQLVDAAAELDNRENTSTLSNPYRSRRGAVSESRIDYAFCRAGEAHGADPVRIERVLDEVFELEGLPVTYSDHHGLLVDVELTNTGAARALPDPAAIAEARNLLEHGRRVAHGRRTFERLVAAGGLVGTGAIVGVRQRPFIKRRTLLRLGLYGSAGAALASSVGFTVLSERFVPEELAGFDAVERTLDAIAAESVARVHDCAHRVSLA